MRQVDDFSRLIIENVPLIDLRAPVEYAKGAVPTAVNLPILVDSERHEVGSCHKQKGPAAALELGAKLVSGETRITRLKRWSNFVTQHPGALLYCHRGGKRSQVAQEWLAGETGVMVPRLRGGYKAMRTFLLEQLSPAKLCCSPILLGGRTGSGKTLILAELQNSIDLEGLANHRGSTFGRFLTPQPSQVDFENSLAWQLVQHCNKGYGWLVLEDEGRYVGSRNIPREVGDFFNGGDLIILEESLEKRLEIIFEEYITGGQREYLKHFGTEEGLRQWFLAMNSNVERIKKRLGGEKTMRVKGLMEDAWQQQIERNCSQGHVRWLEVLIREYYDPMYDYQMSRKIKTVVFKGNSKEVREFIRNLE